MLEINPLASANISRLDPLGEKAAKKKIAVKEMEQYFATMLFREMRKTVPDSKLFPSSQMTKFTEDMLYDTLATKIAESGQLGIAKLLSEQINLQEMQKSIQADLARKHAGVKG